MRIAIERLDENDNITGVGTALQRGITLDDYRTNSGSPLELRCGEKFVRYLTLPPTGKMPREIELGNL